MKIPSVKEIIDYYPTYLEAHKNVWNRRLHVLGQTTTVCYFILILFLAFQNPPFIFLMLFLPFVVYPFAWFGHLVFEKNKPATWYINPLITKACDWIMLKDILKRKLPW